MEWKALDTGILHPPNASMVSLQLALELPTPHYEYNPMIHNQTIFGGWVGGRPGLITMCITF